MTREIQLLIGRVQRDEQIEHLVENFVRIGVVAIDLVDDDDRLGAGFQRFAQHEARLGLGTVGGIDHQQHAVDHVHDPLDFAAEIGVAGGVDDVDVVILVFESGVLGADGDALFPLQIHGIHDALFGRDGLVGAEGAGLLQQAIDQRRFAMIDVSDNGDIANMLHKIVLKPKPGWLDC